MASSRRSRQRDLAPFGSDDQGAIEVKIVGGRQVESFNRKRLAVKTAQYRGLSSPTSTFIEESQQISPPLHPRARGAAAFASLKAPVPWATLEDIGKHPPPEISPRGRKIVNPLPTTQFNPVIGSYASVPRSGEVQEQQQQLSEKIRPNSNDNYGSEFTTLPSQRRRLVDGKKQLDTSIVPNDLCHYKVLDGISRGGERGTDNDGASRSNNNDLNHFYLGSRRDAPAMIGRTDIKGLVQGNYSDQQRHQRREFSSDNTNSSSNLAERRQILRPPRLDTAAMASTSAFIDAYESKKRIRGRQDTNISNQFNIPHKKMAPSPEKVAPVTVFDSAWRERFKHLVNALNQMDEKSSGYLDVDICRRITKNYGLIFQLHLKDDAIESALSRCHDFVRIDDYVAALRAATVDDNRMLPSVGYVAAANNRYIHK